MEKQKLYEKGLENYPKATVVLTNVLLLLWFGFAAYGISALRFDGLPIISIIYLLFVILMVKEKSMHALLLLQQVIWHGLG